MENQDHNSRRESERVHSSEYIWQILVPILASVLITLVIGITVVFISANGAGMDEKWAHIALIFLILPSLVIGLVLLAVSIFTSRLVSRFHNFLPPQFARLNKIVTSGEGFARVASDKVTQPLIDLNSIVAGAIRLLELAFHRGQAQRRKK
jgi:ABC-type dipeptide/oligopeptide/nickel transport system permease subunit